jgi:hypothetical protein
VRERVRDEGVCLAMCNGIEESLRGIQNSLICPNFVITAILSWARTSCWTVLAPKLHNHEKGLGVQHPPDPAGIPRKPSVSKSYHLEF